MNGVQMEMSDSISQALGLIDDQLERVQSREIISSTEVSDLLLDIRLVLMRLEPIEEPATSAISLSFSFCRSNNFCEKKSNCCPRYYI